MTDDQLLVALESFANLLGLTTEATDVMFDIMAERAVAFRAIQQTEWVNEWLKGILDLLIEESEESDLEMEDSEEPKKTSGKVVYTITISVPNAKDSPELSEALQDFQSDIRERLITVMEKYGLVNEEPEPADSLSPDEEKGFEKLMGWLEGEEDKGGNT